MFHETNAICPRCGETICVVDNRHNALYCKKCGVHFSDKWPGGNSFWPIMVLEKSSGDFFGVVGNNCSLTENRHVFHHRGNDFWSASPFLALCMQTFLLRYLLWGNFCPNNWYLGTVFPHEIFDYSISLRLNLSTSVIFFIHYLWMLSFSSGRSSFLMMATRKKIFFFSNNLFEEERPKKFHPVSG